MSIDRRRFLGDSSLLLSAGAVGAAATAGAAHAQTGDDGAVSAEAFRAVQRQLEQVTTRLAALEATQAVRELHFKYGYYIDMCLYDEAADLFADNAELLFLNGIYRGRAGARRLYCDWFREMFTEGHNGPVHGLLLDHLQMQDVIQVAADGRSAKGRFRCLLLGGQHRTKDPRVQNLPEHFWEHGVYENEYVIEDGVWKIQRLNYNMLWQADYDDGPARGGVHLQPLERTYPDDPIGPDELVAEVPATWPDTRVVPFHYAHPVTGETWNP